MELRPNSKGYFPVIEAMAGGVFNVALGNGTQYRVGLIKMNAGFFIGVEGKGAYQFSGYAHRSYVAEKLGFRFEGDAANFSDFINDLLCFADGDEPTERQGSYQRALCREVIEKTEPVD